MAQTGRSNVRYVDPRRRYTVVLGPSWNAPFEALPHDDRAGTHDSADGQCGSYASIGRGQAATKIFRQYPQRVQPLGIRHERTVTGPWVRSSAVATERLCGRSDRTPPKL